MKNISNNTVAIISDLLGTIQNSDASFFTNVNDPISPAFIIGFGIRSLTLNAVSDGSPFSGHRLATPGSPDISQDLKPLFTNCHIISFADWSDINGASDLWDGLLLDTIKPLRKKDFEFIFYLGDPAKKLVQEVDEVLDIISEFSLCGRVTFVLDEEEASKLWMVLNGYDPGISFSSLRGITCLGEKWLSIFNTMNIDHLVIYGVDQTLSFSKQEQFEIRDRSRNNVGIAKDARDNFNAGYCLGLQHQLEISRCIALGLAVSGSYMEHGIDPDRSALLSYIKEWIAELGAPRLVTRS